MSLIYVEDLAQLLLDLATNDAAHHDILEPDDGKPGAWDHRDLARAIGAAVGVSVMPLSLPRSLLGLVARIDGDGPGEQGEADARPRGVFLSPRLDRPPARYRRTSGPRGRTRARRWATTARWYRTQGLL